MYPNKIHRHHQHLSFTTLQLKTMRYQIASLCKRAIDEEFRQLRHMLSQAHHSTISASIHGESNGTNHSKLSNIEVTQTISSSLQSHNVPLPNEVDDTALVDSLLEYTHSLVEKSGSNIIAFSGGVDSSLAAALVNHVFTNNSMDQNRFSGNVKAVIGVSSSLPQRQLDLARHIAEHIDIELMEVKTTEGTDETYIANEGKACFICKNHLYSALEAVTSKANEISLQSNDRNQKVALFNGTNADDTKDPTRLGLLSAKSFSVRSPLINITKTEVRRAARHLNLPNWNYAASPCLRSRLALGVEATASHLKAVNLAEERVRKVLSLDETVNLRVRMLAGKKAMVELDHHLIQQGEEEPKRISDNDHSEIISFERILRDDGFEEFCKKLGFDGGIGVRPFKTGSVSVKRKE